MRINNPNDQVQQSQYLAGHQHHAMGDYNANTQYRFFYKTDREREDEERRDFVQLTMEKPSALPIGETDTNH